MNKFIFTGRLTKEPEIRQTTTGKKVANFTVAIESEYQDGNTLFMRCVAWEKTADYLEKHLKKGNRAVIISHIEDNAWKDKNGNTQHQAEAVVERFEDVFDWKEKQAEEPDQGDEYYPSEPNYGIPF